MMHPTIPDTVDLIITATSNTPEIGVFSRSAYEVWRSRTTTWRGLHQLTTSVIDDVVVQKAGTVYPFPAMGFVLYVEEEQWVTINNIPPAVYELRMLPHDRSLPPVHAWWTLPRIILVQNWNPTPPYGSRGEFLLIGLAAEEFTSQMRVSPYPWGNVYQNGKICWGSTMPVRKVEDPLSTWRQFIQGVGNNDLWHTAVSYDGCLNASTSAEAPLSLPMAGLRSLALSEYLPDHCRW